MFLLECRMSNVIKKGSTFILLLSSLIAYSEPGPLDFGLFPDEINSSGLPFNQAPTTQPLAAPKRIKSIIITGNHLVPTDAVEARIPYHVGDVFKATKSAQLIKTLYGLGYFRNITLNGEDVEPGFINLHIILEEKKKIEAITFEGNKHLPQDQIEKKLKLSEIPTLDAEEFERLIQQIKKLYIEKNYHDTIITGSLIPVDEHKARVHFIVEEGTTTLIKRIFIKGNHHIPGRKLRDLLYSREDWILGFMNKSGSYHPEALEYDKHLIENYYQSNGFLAGHVVDIEKEYDSNRNLTLTFIIDEGDIYTIDSVSAPGNEIMTEEQILSILQLRPGMLYSKEYIRQAMERLRLMWGEYGYIYADVMPSIQPDQKNKTVSVKFITDLGNKITVNRINIMGNQKTRDKVIRRSITFSEGSIAKTKAMDDSKNRVQGLGYFDQRNGVNWRITRLDDERADLDLMLNEVKTGRASAQIGFGGSPTDIKSPNESFSISANATDINFLGTGISYNLSGMYSKQDRNIMFSVSNPWAFDRPLFLGGDFYHRRSTYDEFTKVQSPPVEFVNGGRVNLGFKAPRLYYTQFIFDSGYDAIRYPTPVRANLENPFFNSQLQIMCDKLFRTGSIFWLNANISQDYRNHPRFPSSGYLWSINAKVAFPTGINNYSFFRLVADVNWFTPLINEYDLILHLRGFLGYVTPILSRSVPYREFFHIGGPATVRGFLFGQIGPQLFGDSIGAQKAFCLSAELIFPIMADGSMRGILFYDGGAGWDAPYRTLLNDDLIRNNHFHYRHAVGIGVRLTVPTPVRIDVGFKLDRNRRAKEPISQIHFGTSIDF